jgi:hypothetical protein
VDLGVRGAQLPRIDVAQVQTPVLDVQQRQVPDFDIPELPRVPDGFTPPGPRPFLDVPPPPGVPVFDLPSFDDGFSGVGRASPGPRKGYAPSLLAIELELTSKEFRKDVTGAGVRPLIVGRKKKKSKRQKGFESIIGFSDFGDFDFGF